MPGNCCNLTYAFVWTDSCRNWEQAEGSPTNVPSSLIQGKGGGREFRAECVSKSDWGHVGESSCVLLSFTRSPISWAYCLK